MADNYCKCCGDGTPEYIIELNQQGAPGKRGEKGEQGYSPIVDFIVDDNEIKFTSTNEDNITSTPNLYDYVLKKDGTNALNPIKLNNIYIKNNSIYTQSSSIDFGNSSSNNQHIANIYYKNIHLKGNSPYLGNDHGTLTIRGQDSLSIEAVSGNISLGNTIHITGGIPYIGTQDPNNKIATIGDIPEVSDSKITISQGDVEKGSFTLNQSGDTTIELDTGVTNPLKITKDNKTLEIGYDENDRAYISNTTTGAGGGTSTNIALITPNVYNDPIRLQQITNIPDLAGQYYVKLNYDNNTLKLNDNKQLYADFTEVNNSITELTTLVGNTETSLNELRTDYESNKTEVAGELTNLGNQINNKQDTLIAGNNITIVDNVISATGGAGDVTADGDNRFTGDNTFTGKVNIAGGALTVEGLANINQATVQYLNAVNITSPGEINATSIKANGLRSDDIQTTENKKYLTEADVDNQTIQIVEGKLHANLPDLSNYVTLTSYNELLARVEALEAEINGGNA